MITKHKSAIKNIKNFIISSINYFNKFFKQKKIIDNMYSSIIKDKTAQINKLKIDLKAVNQKNTEIVHKISTIKNSIDKKNKLIKSIQDLTSRRIN
ncbi:hypothetical protein J2Z42_002396 [Clostridium algifaecis]|uniref:Uncharacterized protein n=1 Tax=Clostridium algifaecis TaxID=1472040 RepID=A0ABS4KUF5_9CLOT|nr:hypothetical protein [Clostridium algifaecis]MBP2033689.1 hypothetical protein [Clostridium algifaecis]